MFEFRNGGSRVSQDQFFKNLKQQAIDSALKHLEEKVYGAASSIIDPETGKHSDVFVRRKGNDGLVIRTKGSPAFARELEKRLGADPGEVKSMHDGTEPGVPQVYLAHAFEDHETLARPLAERMMAEGIEVWFDEWEIRSGDSLKRKMEEGLAGCTHFVVLLTPNSLGKPWVETEIDAGFVQMVEDGCRFIGVPVDVLVGQLSPFLRTLRCPAVTIGDERARAELIADIYGVSRKPPRGETPRYVKTVPEGLATWSPSAIAVAEYLVRKSEHADVMDPQTDVAQVAAATGLPEEDIRLGVLDLKDNGLVEESESIGSEDFWPRTGLFVEFDRHFMDFNNEDDAVAIANWLINEKLEEADADQIAKQFPDWKPRRLNSALGYLEEAKAIEPVKCIGSGPYAMSHIMVTNRTRRFVRDRG
jgi:hypothetical protein